MVHSKVGKGTYYPGRTKPLCLVPLSPLAKSLEKQRATFASPCGNKGEVYKLEMIGHPGKYRYALLNDRVMRHTCDKVGKTADEKGSPLMPNGRTVPLVDLSFGLAEYFGIRGKLGVGQFRATLLPRSEHARVALNEGVLPADSFVSNGLQRLIHIVNQIIRIFNPDRQSNETVADANLGAFSRWD